jgi:hypothetical protein
MTDRQPDAELRARFEAQRDAEAKQAPSFESMLARARAGATAADAAATTLYRVKRRRFVYSAGVAAAAVIAALLVIPRAQSSEAAFEQAVRAFQTNPALGGWQSPTDGLLDVPGSQLISTVPGVGTQQ